MNCLQCGLEMKAEIFKDVSRNFGKNCRQMNYECIKCDIGFNVLMYNLYHVKNNLKLTTHGGLRVARNI